MNIHVHPARRLAEVQEYYFSRKLKEVARLRAAGHDIVSLAIGCPDLPPSPTTIETLCRAAHEPAAHAYQPTVGTPELREAMARFYQRWFGVQLDPTCEIQPLIGSKEGILHTTLAFVDHGDQVLVPDPGYPTYTSLSRLLGAQPVPYNLRPERGWQPDFDELEAMDTSRVRLLWCNYPHMPTGARACRETYERLVDFAQRRNLVVVNDNPYSFILNEDEHLSILAIDGAKECCIELNSMSKSHNMPGWRVGMLAANAEFVSWILKVKSNIDSGTFRAVQLAAAAAMDNDEDWHREHNVRRYAERRTLAESIMQALGCRFDRTQTGLFLWGRIPDALADAEELTERTLHEADVFITPGGIFGQNGRRYVRISLCADENRMSEALARIQNVFA